MKGVSIASSSLTRQLASLETGGRLRASSSDSVSAPASGNAVRRAAMKYLKKLPRSLSASSSDSQAWGSSRESSQ